MLVRINLRRPIKSCFVKSGFANSGSPLNDAVGACRYFKFCPSACGRRFVQGPRSDALVVRDPEVVLFQPADLVAQPRGLFELEVGGGFPHPLLKVAYIGLEIVADEVRTDPSNANLRIGRFVDARRAICNFEDVTGGLS